VRDRELRPHKKFQKKFKKELDKQNQICYNKDVPRGTENKVTCD
jgi:hypothetical protein